MNDRLVDEGLGEGDVVPEDELDSIRDAVDCCVVSGEGETGRRCVEGDYYSICLFG